MSYYRDHRVTITSDKISIRGVPFPVISVIIFEAEDIASLETMDRTLFNRLMVSGPLSRNTWSAFDPLSIVRGKAVLITLKEPLLGFDKLALTFSDFNSACGVLGDHYGHLGAPSA